MVLLTGTVFVLTQRNVTTTVSFDDAVEAFRADHADGPAAAEAAPIAVTAATEEDEAGKPAARGAEPELNAALGPEAAPVEQGSADAVDYAVPAPGVYAYRTTGGESVSMFGAKHDYPERSFATVRKIDGCGWEHRLEVIAEHVDIRGYCGEGGVLRQLFYETHITFLGKREVRSMPCEPVINLHRREIAAGDAQNVSCSDGAGSQARMTRTFHGTVPITIGGEKVEAFKVTIAARMSGNTKGTSRNTLWVEPTTGLTLRWDRTTDTLAKAYGATVRYKENASFVLEALAPQR